MRRLAIADRPPGRASAEAARSSRLSSRPAVLVSLLLAALVNSGCATGLAVKETIGDRAQLEIRLVDDRAPSPRIFWRENPTYAETLLTLHVAPPGCDRVRLFVNPSRRRARELGMDALTVAPLELEAEAQLRELIGRLPEDPCAAVLFAGAIEETGFRGLITLAGEHRETAALALAESIPPKPGFALLVPFAPVYDFVYAHTMYPFAAAMLAADRAGDPFPEPVAVDFEFPDGTSRRFEFDHARARDLLDVPHAPTGPMMLVSDWRLAAFWVRAALVESNMDFRLQGSVREGIDPPDVTMALTRVGDFEGNWVIDIGDEGVDANYPTELMRGMVRYRALRLRIPKDDAPP